MVMDQEPSNEPHQIKAPDGSPLPHPRALAFLGDAVFEVKLRELAVQQGFNQSDDLHRFTTQRVNATAQAGLLQHLKPHLSENELEIVRQARNVAVGATRRSDQATYRQATSFEALIGFLFLTHHDRLEKLWSDVMVPYLLEEQPLNPKK